jgi:ABC-type glycerol-3-phosphate transport system permease component
MGTILVEPYRPQLEALFAIHGLPACRLLAVPSVQAWGAERGIAVDSSHCGGLAATDDGVPLVVLALQQTPEMQRSVTGAMAVRGLGDETPRIARATAFLEHLTLHELAHHLLHTEDDLVCDRWAFDHLAGRLGRTIPTGRQVAVVALVGPGLVAAIAAYGLSIWQVYHHRGLGWALLAAVLPGISQAFWWGVTVHDVGFFTLYTDLCLVAVLGLGLAALLAPEGGALRPR